MNGRDEELLSAYFDGELPDAEKSRAEQLLTEDVGAREALDEVAEVSGWIRALPRPAAPEAIQRDVMARILNGAAPQPISPATNAARPSKWRQARWAAVSAAGLLLAVVLYQSWPETDLRMAANVERSGHVVDEGADDVSVLGTVEPRAAEMLAYRDDQVRVARSNSMQLQQQFAQMLESGDAPVAGEERSDLAQIGNRVVVIKYRVVDVEKLPGEVHLMLTENGIVDVAGVESDAPALAEAGEHSQLEAFYVEAPESKFESALTSFYSINGVTDVSTNYVSTLAAPAENASGREWGIIDESVNGPPIASPATDFVPSGAPADEPHSPLGLAAAPASADPSASESAPAEGRGDASTPEVPKQTAAGSRPDFDAYQVAVPAEKALLEELREQEVELRDQNGDGVQEAKVAQAPKSSPALRQSRFFDRTKEQSPPPPSQRIRAVIVLVPEKSP